MSNEISLVSGSTGVSHNGTFRGKNLGTISNLNEYIAFRSAHGIDDKSYKDLYLGDYFKIQDGTYNVLWVVAHFDYHNNHGEPAGGRGVVLIPRTACGSTKMNATENKTDGAYKASVAYTTACPAIATALSSILGSYLLSSRIFITNTMNGSMPSNAGLGWTGTSTNGEWVSVQAILPSESQIYGTHSYSSSPIDTANGCLKLAIFNFINFNEYGNYNFWLKDVSSSSQFCFARANGNPHASGASSAYYLRPLIYIG